MLVKKVSSKSEEDSSKEIEEDVKDLMDSILEEEDEEAKKIAGEEEETEEETEEEEEEKTEKEEKEDKKETEEEKAEEEEEEEEKKEETKEEEEEEKEEETEEEEEEEDTESILETSRNYMNEMAKTLLNKKYGEEKAEPPEKKEEKKEKPSEEKPSPLDITLSEDEWEEALRSKDGFEKVMSKFVKASLSKINDLQKDIPKTVNNIATQIITIRSATRDFYRQNPDLVPFKPFVGVVADKILAENPDKDIEDVFGLVEKEVRDKLKLRKEILDKKEEKEEDKKGIKTSIRKKRKVRPRSPVLSKEEKEIAELFE